MGWRRSWVLDWPKRDPPTYLPIPGRGDCEIEITVLDFPTVVSSDEPLVAAFVVTVVGPRCLPAKVTVAAEVGSRDRKNRLAWTEIPDKLLKITPRNPSAGNSYTPGQPSQRYRFHCPSEDPGPHDSTYSFAVADVVTLDIVVQTLEGNSIMRSRTAQIVSRKVLHKDTNCSVRIEKRFFPEFFSGSSEHCLPGSVSLKTQIELRQEPNAVVQCQPHADSQEMTAANPAIVAAGFSSTIEERTSLFFYRLSHSWNCEDDNLGLGYSFEKANRVLIRQKRRRRMGVLRW